MRYNEPVEKKKQRISKVLVWVFGIATTAGIVVTIIFHKQEFWWALMIGTMFLFSTPFLWALAWNTEIGIRLRINHYLESVKDITLFEDILQLRLEKTLFAIVKKYGFRSWSLAPKEGIPLIGFIKTKKKRILSAELFKSELKYYIGDKKTEEQDIEESEWIAVAYGDIKENCDIYGLLEFLSGIEIC